jgi:hypothetical protein
VRNKEVLQTVRRRGISCVQSTESRVTECHVLRGKSLLKYVIEGKIGRKNNGEGEEEDVTSYWMTLKNTGN